MFKVSLGCIKSYELNDISQWEVVCERAKYQTPSAKADLFAWLAPNHFIATITRLTPHTSKAASPARLDTMKSMADKGEAELLLSNYSTPPASKSKHRLSISIALGICLLLLSASWHGFWYFSVAPNRFGLDLGSWKS